MRKNLGNIFLNPSENLKEIEEDYITKISTITDTNDIDKDSPVKLADLSYFNYALDDTQISSLYSTGFNKDLTKLVNIQSGINPKKPEFITGTKIDMALYNETNASIPVKPI